MKDFDFDEIDRAVNSANSGIQPSDSTSASDDENTSSQPTDQLQDKVKLSLPLAGRRSTGQFMDVVHPSSDMRRAPLVMPERNSPPVPAEKKPLLTPERPNNSTESNPESSTVKSHEWPDPIDFHNSRISPETKSDVTDEVQPESEDADIDKINDLITDDLNKKNEESSDFPFISGTKVEKRPLGAFSSEPPVQTPQQTEQVDVDNKAIDEGSNRDLKDGADKSLPDELQDDLLKIESDENKVIEETTADDVVKPVENTTSTSENNPVANVSINQQYKEQPSTGDQSTGAIYDTDSYHKAIVRPVKKKSSWLWLAWVLLLIVAGVAAGAAVYKFVIPYL